MLEYKEIELLKQEENKKQTVFCCIYCKDAQPYLNYTEVPEDMRKRIFPLCLMLMRWNGKLGFVGGNVDKGEDLKTALIREVSEEINYTIKKETNVIPLSTHSNDKMNTHLYMLEVNFKELKEIQKNIVDSRDYIAETLGSVFVPIIETDNNELKNFLNNNFVASSKQELELVIKKLLEG